MTRAVMLKASICLLAFAGALAFASCDNTAKEEENATVVNIEKGVASPLRVPEGEASADLPGPGPVALQDEVAPADANEDREAETAPADTAAAEE